MRVMVTGHDGYIGAALVPLFQQAGHHVVGVDNGLFRGCGLGVEPQAADEVIWKDIRDLAPEDFKDIDAVVHLAAISNDPMGDLNRDLTFEINHRGTVHVAKQAKAAGVPRFAFSSSCSTYGAAGSDALDETAEFHPVTAYGESKVLAEQDLTKLADDTFSPTYLRNATAYGMSERVRGDLVVNNLTGYAVSTGEVRIMSDGTPWRPLVHIEDISRAFLAIVEADRELVHDKAFNVGRNDGNYQVKDVAAIVGDSVDGSQVTLSDTASPDKRNYKVDCSRIAQTLPAFQPQWTVEKAVDVLRDRFQDAKLTEEMLASAKLTRLQNIKRRQEAGEVDENLRVKNPGQ